MSFSSIGADSRDETTPLNPNLNPTLHSVQSRVNGDGSLYPFVRCCHRQSIHCKLRALLSYYRKPFCMIVYHGLLVSRAVLYGVVTRYRLIRRTLPWISLRHPSGFPNHPHYLHIGQRHIKDTLIHQSTAQCTWITHHSLVRDIAQSLM